ncbi:MAG: mannose-1-phosphate guanylyltransferase [Planctomycetota bacterium]|nr:mannose-1-phosphate guanylyltransferase [Planctomycetota bacterium]
MAGGSGTRFWPESRADYPKQLLNLAGDTSMLQSTVARLGTLVRPEQVLVVTNARLVEPITRQLTGLTVLGEPCKRDTAPAIGLAALYVSRSDPDATMAVMPSDHVISTDEQFQGAIAAAAQLVEQDSDRIVTFGIRPTYPAESFGYIERGEKMSARGTDKVPVYRVLRFREKPAASVAQEFLNAGNFYWNSGIFVWKAKTILQQLEIHQPEMFAHLQQIAKSFDRPDFQTVLEKEFSAIRGVSIDYAVMEHAKEVLVIEAPFAWDDVGSWQAIARLNAADADGNTVLAKYLGVNTTGTIVRGPADHLIVTLGLSDCIVVHTPDATLVARKSDEESIRKVVKLLEERGWTEYL